MGIKDEMPLLARHEGEWEGTYTYVDASGEIVDQHRSHLTCAFPTEESGVDYHQINRYEWDDKEEVHDFPAVYRDGEIWFDTERIRGHAWEVDENTVVLTWVYKGSDEDLSLYEMIQLSPDGNRRARTWQWFRDGEIFQRTLIDERRIGT